ncbi:protein YIPF1 homolog [Ipomoea triloba]|uniref:protein YIPF1 homolog n=1 Tax=Ipomoea triloba TaxID=35885 RepID=UPI00125DF381|nr:protein YIPF1 homolog [Ipomoea triloba]
MDDSLGNIPSSHLLGSVPAVITEEKTNSNHSVPEANLQIFPPNNGGNPGQGYQTLGGPSEGDGKQSTNNWKGVLSVSSYTQYFNVDTDVVMNRLMSSLNPTTGDFFSKIDANPDLYGLIWISTTLVFVLSSFGNCATYIMRKRSETVTSWTFDVSYVNVATCTIYGYTFIVPLGFYFLLQYLGLNASIIRFWCLWGYSLFIFIPTSFLLMIPVEFLKWIIILLTGGASGGFVALNLKNHHIQTNDLSLVLVAAFVLQMGLAIFIKMWFFR